jgi:uncharacterized protein
MTGRFNMIAILAAAMTSTAVQAQPIEVTRAQMDQMIYKVNSAGNFFEATWRDIFQKAGRSYPAPKLVAYTGSTQSRCGEIKANNAHYCGSDNTIYYDALFLTRMMVYAGRQLHTDGDYAPIVVLAHEMGHGVAAQLGINPSYTNNRENLADCLAGVVTGAAKRARLLDEGDLEEGLLALKLGGDGPDTPFSSDHAHGPADERQVMFMRGYRGGLPACSEALAVKLTSLPKSSGSNAFAR